MRLSGALATVLVLLTATLLVVPPAGAVVWRPDAGPYPGVESIAIATDGTGTVQSHSTGNQYPDAFDDDWPPRHSTLKTDFEPAQIHPGDPVVVRSTVDVETTKTDEDCLGPSVTGGEDHSSGYPTVEYDATGGAYSPGGSVARLPGGYTPFTMRADSLNAVELTGHMTIVHKCTPGSHIHGMVENRVPAGVT